MATWLWFRYPKGCERRYPTPRLAVERILKRFGAQTLCCCLALFFSSFPSYTTTTTLLPLLLPVLPVLPSPLKRLLPFLGEGSFKGLRERWWGVGGKKKRCSSSPQLDPGVVEPRGKINS